MQTIPDSLPRKTTGTENPSPDSPSAALAATPDSGKTRNQCAYLQVDHHRRRRSRSTDPDFQIGTCTNQITEDPDLPIAKEEDKFFVVAVVVAGTREEDHPCLLAGAPC
ncbi:hypothetical protein MRB53_006865 [Persea americana]|uniref:Uncharacterized protein n=1 Tax=Persea americana TaxID=3435 RepID=A0ACC2MH74_PERAE|nr:hypothetical protein MRB53_006865 [Persea americana]